MGLRVQTVEDDKVTYSHSFIRNISKIYWLLLPLDWLIGVATPGGRIQKYTAPLLARLWFKRKRLQQHRLRSLRKNLKKLKAN